MGFEHPLALLGLVAAGLPLLIHLMRRKDLPVIPLGTVSLLARARASTRQKQRLADLLLLLLRMALVALAALVLAGPHVMRTRAPRHEAGSQLAIVLDDSASMGRRAAHATCFTAARDRALTQLTAVPEGVAVSLVAAGAPPRVLVSKTTDHAAVRTALASLSGATGRATDLARAVTMAANELGGEGEGTPRVVVLSDFAAQADPNAMNEAARRARVDLVMQTMPACERVDNVGIVSAEAAPDPTRQDGFIVVVEVAASGDWHRPVALTIRSDDSVLARTDVAPQGRTTRVQLPIRLHEPPASSGPAAIRIVLEVDDALAADDVRVLLPRARSDAQALVVDGDPHVARADAESRFLVPALEANAAPVHVATRLVDPASLPHAALSEYDFVVLANVPLPDASTREALAEFVRRGGGLMIAAGQLADPRAYATAWAALLPARPSAIESARAGSAWRMRVEAPASALAGSPPFSQTTRRWALAERASEATLLARYDDEQPALLARAVGDGVVVLWTTTVDDDWTDLPYRPEFVALLAETAQRLAGSASMARGAVVAGTQVALPARDPHALRIVGPGGPISAVRDAAFERSTFTPELPGLYRVSFTTGRRAPRAFSVVPAPAESALAIAEGMAPTRGAPNARRAGASGVAKERVPVPLEPWLLFGFACVAVVEGWLRLRDGTRRAAEAGRATPST